jgi:1,2-dihydroxy-3-keto-5-methylthiopentene dioxygenase
MYREWTSFPEIAETAAGAGIRFERWRAEKRVDLGASEEEVLAAYSESVDRLKRASGFLAADVVRVSPETPNHHVLRAKFLAEHTHDDDEARFFVEGRGLFMIHLGRAVYSFLCEAGDLINIPARTRHWYDMGPVPRFTAIRLFTSPEGWVASFTESGIDDLFPRLRSDVVA